MAAVRGIYRKFEAFFSGMGPTSTTHVNLLHSAATFGHLPMNSYHSHLYTTTHKQVSACSQDLVGECQCVLHWLVLSTQEMKFVLQDVTWQCAKTYRMSRNSVQRHTGCHVTVCKDIQDVTWQSVKTYRMSRNSVQRHTGCHMTVCKDIQDVTWQCVKTYKILQLIFYLVKCYFDFFSPPHSRFNYIYANV